MPTFKEQCTLGMVGLGVMGRNLLLNMADHHFTVAGYDKDTQKVDSLKKEAQENKTVQGATNVADFIDLLQKPRAIMLLVPAGAPVDLVINDLLPHLEAGDLIIDGGNSHFTDTDIRTARLKELGIHFLGVGISGGEQGARRGPSIMPGGPKEAYEQVRPLFEAVAATINKEPCVAYIGPASSGHYVKMVHNGIEYGLMQLIAETYDLMKRGLGLKNNELYTVYRTWNSGEMNSYLIEITSQIFEKMDGNKSLIDEILAVAKQNGTGMWTSQSAMELQIPTPTIDLAVSMRDLSVLVKQRNEASQLYDRPIPPITLDHNKFIIQIHDALYSAMVIVYAQGMALLTSASEKYGYQLNLESIARIWRGGCIIRAKILEDIRIAYQSNPNLSNLLLAPNIAQKIMKNQDNLRQVIANAAVLGIPLPGLMVTLSYLDAYRSQWSPANLIQAQRDYFGSHTYERINETGTFHTIWEKDVL